MFLKFKAIIIAVLITAAIVAPGTFFITWKYFSDAATIVALTSKLAAKERDLQAAQAFQKEAIDAKARLQNLETDYNQTGKEYADALKKSAEGQAGSAGNFIIGDSDAEWLRKAK